MRAQKASPSLKLQADNREHAHNGQQAGLHNRIGGHITSFQT